MKLFKPPAVRRVVTANLVLEGGRTRLRIAISGWGLLTLSLTMADGTVAKRRVLFYGKARERFVDMLPPGEVTVDVRNPFGGDSARIAVATDLPGIVALPAPLVQPLAKPWVPPRPIVFGLPEPVVKIPVVQHRNAPTLRLGTIAVKAFHELRQTESDR